MGVHELNKRKAEAADCRCSFAAGMEERARSRCAPYFFAGTAQTHGRTRSQESRRRFIARSGYRASIAASILKEEGFDELWNVPGSWEAWKKAKFPVEGADGQ